MPAAGAPSAALEALASGALAGPERRAWDLLRDAWPEFHGRLRACLAAARLPADLRDDCGQIVAARVWRFRTSYRGASLGELCAWMNRIARNEAARLLARTGRQAGQAADEPGEALEAAVEPRRGPAERAEARDDLSALEACLAELEQRARSVVELLYAEPALSEREVEEVLGISKSHVHTLRKQALAALARCLGRKGVA